MPPTFTTGQKLGPYLLLDHLGSGGLGEVWKARDTRLNRVIALKFIRPSRPGSSPVTELLREARAASGLNHPNIVIIYDVGEAGETTYLAMEYVPGETLRAVLQRGTPELPEALEIAGQVAEGLAAAHQEGIIHRDLKPENVMVRTDGVVKLLDFGLAKVLPWAQAASVGATAGASATETGQVIGTITYMSPEQARGQGVTPASDVFSFGIVLYELLSGQHPFRAPTNLDTLSAILTREPEPVASHRAGIPPPVAELVGRALKKEPTERFQNMADLAGSLRRARFAPALPAAGAPAPSVRHKPRWMQTLGVALLAVLLSVSAWFFWPHGGSASSGSAVRSMAVMNLQAEAGASETDIVRALPEDLGAALTRSGFQVVSHQSVAALGEIAGARVAGQQLGVDGVIEGSVRRAGSRLRIHLELVNSKTGFQVWSGNLVLESQDDVLAQDKLDELAGQIRKALSR